MCACVHLSEWELCKRACLAVSDKVVKVTLRGRTFLVEVQATEVNCSWFYHQILPAKCLLASPFFFFLIPIIFYERQKMWLLYLVFTEALSALFFCLFWHWYPSSASAVLWNPRPCSLTLPLTLLQEREGLNTRQVTSGNVLKVLFSIFRLVFGPQAALSEPQVKVCSA